MPKPKLSKREILAVLKVAADHCTRLARQYGAKTHWSSATSEVISNINKHQALCLREAVRIVRGAK